MPKVTINLNSKVTQVDYTNNQVALSFVNGSQETVDIAIVAVPLGVLKHDKIIFNPALPQAKQRAIERTDRNFSSMLDFSDFKVQ